MINQATMKKISIAVVEDHKLVREMWVRLFDEDSQMVVVGQSGDFDDAIEMIKTVKPDIVLLDINLPKGSGLDAVPLIRKFVPATRIIAVSMHNQPAYTKKMIQMGAKGYVTKNSSPQEMLTAIKEVMENKIFVCAEIKEILSSQLINNDPSETNLKDLSLREIEIISLIKLGFSSKEIAEKLHIAVRTVEVHRYNILKKLDLKNTAALINFIGNTEFNF